MLKMRVTMDIQAARASMKEHIAEVNKAAARALDRVATTARKEADQEIRTRLSLKSSRVKDNIKVVRPYGNKVLIRDITAKGGPIPLKDYSARNTRKGVTFKIGKNNARKVYKRQGRPAFINPRWGGGHVYVRTAADPPGPATAPITKVYGPGIEQGFRAGRTQKRLDRVVRERWPIEFNREIAYRRTKLGLR